MLVKTESGEVDVNLDEHEDAVKEHFTKKGFVVKPQAEIDTEITKVRTEKEKEVSTATSKAHTDWEKTFEDVFGVKKPEGTKGLEWFKSTATEFKKKAEEKKEEPDPGKNKVDDDKASAELKALQKKVEDFEKNASDKEKEQQQKVVNSALRASTKRLSIAGDSDEEVAKMRQRLEKLIQGDYSLQLDSDDELIVYKDGEVVVDSDTNKPIAFNKLVEKEYAFALKKEDSERKKVTGTGTNQDDVTKDSVDPKKGIKRKTEDEIREYMRAKGFIAGSKEWREFFDNSMKESGLTAK